MKKKTYPIINTKRKVQQRTIELYDATIGLVKVADRFFTEQELCIITDFIKECRRESLRK